MLNPTTKKWELDPSLYPFGGYLPMSNVELDTSFQEKILIRSCQEILKSLVSSYQRRQNSVKVTFHLQDALGYCYTEKTIKFDVVDCSFLADPVGLPNLISACSGILADHPDAILCVETQYWSDFDYSMQKYIEESLCCPLSMIPTIYGLRLMNHITLGPVSLDLEHKSRQFLWQKTPSFENVILSPSPPLTCCLDRLAKKCFAVEFPFLKDGNETKNLFSAKWYSPLTFNYILSSMILRLGGESWFQDVHHNSNIPPAFQLMTKILDAWQKDQPLLKLTAQSNVRETEVIYSNYSPSGTPLLRLILAPESTHKNFEFPGENGLKNNPRDISSFPDVHIIDNFSLDVQKTPEGNCAFVSFLMLPDHGLGKTHHAVLMDIVNNVPAFIFDSIESMQTENFQLSYPFDLKNLENPPVRGENTLMTLDSCVEFEDKYQLEVTADYDDVSGFKVFLSQPQQLKTAFISTHVVKLSLGPLVDSNPLRISFSHPVCDEELAIVPQGHTFKVTLKKGVHVTWPCEIQRNDKLKWDATKLEDWWDAPHGSNSMRMHLDSQFELYHLEYYPSLERTKPLNAVRDVIRESFYQPNFGYLQLGMEPDDILRVLIHQPCVTSPTGRPMLVLSVHDPQMQKTLATKGKLNALHQHDAIFNRFYAELEGSTLMKMFTTPEEMILWRYIFRVNSTKILPNAWQKKNLPLGADSPWLVTFLSPHYLDCPFKKVSYEEFKLKNPKIVEKLDDIKGGCCAACRKTCESLERCIRCVTVKYCSGECQRGHWSQHRSVCGK